MVPSLTRLLSIDTDFTSIPFPLLVLSSYTWLPFRSSKYWVAKEVKVNLFIFKRSFDASLFWIIIQVTEWKSCKSSSFCPFTFSSRWMSVGTGKNRGKRDFLTLESVNWFGLNLVLEKEEGEQEGAAPFEIDLKSPESHSQILLLSGDLVVWWSSVSDNLCFWWLQRELIHRVIQHH